MNGIPGAAYLTYERTGSSPAWVKTEPGFKIDKTPTPRKQTNDELRQHLREKFKELSDSIDTILANWAH